MKLSTLMNATGRARLLAMLITLLLAFSLSACGDDGDDKSDNNKDTADVVSDEDTTPNDEDTTPDDEDTTPSTPDTDDDEDTEGPNLDTPVPDHEGVDGTNGTTCEELYDCRQFECEPTDGECLDACVDAASDLAIARLNDYSTCLQTNCGGLTGGPFTECQFTYCEGITIACIGEPDQGVCLEDCALADPSTCAGDTVCTNLGVVVCADASGAIPADAQDCTYTGTCDIDGQTCYTTSGGGGTPQPGAACIDNCVVDEDCAGELSCVALNDTVNGCIMVQGESLIIPEGATDCLDDASVCGDTQTCVNYGGGGNEGSGQTDCSLFPDTSSTCTEPTENCYTADAAGNTACYPFNPAAEVGDACEALNGCNDGQACLGNGTDFFCFEVCDASATTTTCSGGENSTCTSLDGDFGYCQNTIPPNPDAEVGDECGPDVGGCADTQYCITFSDEAGNVVETSCQTACDSSDGALCTVEGEVCTTLGGTEELDGICLAPQGA